MTESISNWKRVLLRHLQNVGRGFEILDRVLRGRGETSDDDPPQPSSLDPPQEPTPVSTLSFGTVIAIVLIAAPLYGIAMGSYAGVSGARDWSEQWLQMFYSGIKVPILVGMTLVISLPSFFVVNTLFGLRSEFRESLRAIISAQAGLAIILASMLPITLFVYVSLASLPAGYSRCVIFNTFVFGLASVSAQILLRKYYQPLIERNPRQRYMVRLWILIYGFVGIQAAYVLRPFIGNPRSEVAFFRNEPFENAYVIVVKLVWNLFSSFTLLLGP